MTGYGSNNLKNEEYMINTEIKTVKICPYLDKKDFCCADLIGCYEQEKKWYALANGYVFFIEKRIEFLRVIRMTKITNTWL